MRKLGRFLLGVILFCFLAVATLAVIVTLFSKKNETGAVEFMGYQTLVVISESMEKCSETDISNFEIQSIPKNALIVIQLVPEDPFAVENWYRSLKVGDVLTFRYYYTTQITITHRITSITEKETGGFIIELEGDNKSLNSNQLKQVIDTSEVNSMNYVVGKVKFVSGFSGVVLSALKSPIGLVFLVMVPCVIIIMMEILQINNACVENKRQRESRPRILMDEVLREENKFNTNWQY